MKPLYNVHIHEFIFDEKGNIYNESTREFKAIEPTDMTNIVKECTKFWPYWNKTIKIEVCK